MFQFTEFAPLFSRGTISSIWWVPPFGYLRIYSYLPIPAAFRNLLRPSSPLKAIRHPPMYSLFTFSFRALAFLSLLYVLVLSMISIYNIYSSILSLPLLISSFNAIFRYYSLIYLILIVYLFLLPLSFTLSLYYYMLYHPSLIYISSRLIFPLFLYHPLTCGE
jgi:hypothetical protein